MAKIEVSELSVRLFYPNGVDEKGHVIIYEDGEFNFNRVDGEVVTIEELECIIEVFKKNFNYDKEI